MISMQAPGEPPTGNFEDQDQTDELAEDTVVMLPPSRNRDCKTTFVLSVTRRHPPSPPKKRQSRTLDRPARTSGIESVQGPDPQGSGPRPFPDRGCGPEVRLNRADEPGPGRQGPQAVTMPWKAPLNAFQIAFERWLTQQPTDQSKNQDQSLSGQSHGWWMR
jgi:hypothetical protein